MSDVSIMALAARKTEWLAARQAVLAENVANANTPGFRARDLLSFEAALADTKLQLASTHSGHMVASQGNASGFRAVETDGDRTLNGNNVSLEREMAKLGETNGQYALGVNLIKSHHRLAMLSLKG
jgi:flagellar basal-body rod protein FlgB